MAGVMHDKCNVEAVYDSELQGLVLRATKDITANMEVCITNKGCSPPDWFINHAQVIYEHYNHRADLIIRLEAGDTNYQLKLQQMRGQNNKMYGIGRALDNCSEFEMSLGLCRLLAFNK